MHPLNPNKNTVSPNLCVPIYEKNQLYLIENKLPTSPIWFYGE